MDVRLFGCDSSTDGCLIGEFRDFTARRHSSHVARSGDVERLERLTLGERDISEDWLQKQLYECPELLPIEEIDPGFGPLVPIGREIGTPVGPMDNLYISPQGLLTLVEAKLWRNPQARREVVGQILDYAKEVSRWSYEDIDARTREASGKSLWELVSAAGEPALDQAHFVDAVGRNMRAGRFLLLIVGDGIREEMERLAEFLQGTPQLRFTLALVELQLYRLGSNSQLLVMPIVVARTTEIVRAVVRVISTDTAQVEVSLDIHEEPSGEGSTKRRSLTCDEFFQGLADYGVSPDATEVARRLVDDFGADDRFVIDWKTTSYVIKLRDPRERSRLYSVLQVELQGKVAVWSLAGQLLRVGLPPDLAFNYVRQLGALLGRRPSAVAPDCWEGPPPKLELVGEHYEDCRCVINRLAEAVYNQRRAAESQTEP